MKNSTALRIVHTVSATADAEVLVLELEEDLASSYPPEQRHGLNLSAIFQPHIHFLIGYIDDLPVCCGGIAIFETFAELKRMYVRPQYRGNGYADELIERLLQHAISNNIVDIKLETGTEQHAAIRFYKRMGFEICSAFPPYDAMPEFQIAGSVFMSMTLNRDNSSQNR